MREFGSWTELQSIIFRSDGFAITLQPNGPTTYTANRVFSLPPGDSTQILVSEAATQTLTNKSMSGSANTFTNIPAATAISGQLPTANGGTGVNSTATFPTSGVVVTEAATETLTNKTLDNTNTVTLKDTLFTIQDDGDTTKQAKFQASSISTGTTRTFTFPDASTTLVGTDASQVLTNKTLGSTNTITGATAASFTNTGTVTLFTSSDTVVGKNTTDTLTNKTLTSPVMTAPAVSDFTDYTQTTTPANPASSHNRLYFKSDNNLYTLTSGGVEASVSATPTATPTTLGKVTSYFPTIASAVKIVSSADYTILTTDGFEEVEVTTGASDRTMTLPAAASNAGRWLTFKKVDSGAGAVIIDGNASETIDGALTNSLTSQNAYETIYCNGTEWKVVAVSDRISASASSVTSGNGTYTTIQSVTVPPGSWDFSLVVYSPSTASLTQVNYGLATANNSNTGHVLGDTANAFFCTNGIDTGSSLAGIRKSVTSATTFYLTTRPAGANGSFSVRITAVRVI